MVYYDTRNRTKLNINPREVQVLCKENRVEGAVQVNRIWLIDYVFFIGERLVALMDAKKVSENMAAIIYVQVMYYAAHIKMEHR